MDDKTATDKDANVLPTSIRRVVELGVCAVEPEKVILYGSRAGEMPERIPITIWHLFFRRIGMIVGCDLWLTWTTQQ